MTQSHQSNNGQTNALDPLAQFWTNYLEQANQQTATFLEAMRHANSPQEWRRKWFDALAQSFDAYLRSPLFLDALKRQSEVANWAKGQANEKNEAAIRNVGLPHARDMTTLLDAIRSLDSRLTEQLDRIEERLSALEERRSLAGT